MTEQEINIVVGALLHDIGKVLYRTGDGRNHSVLGYEFLKELGINNKSVLDSVHYHHGKLLAHAQIPDDSIAYMQIIFLRLRIEEKERMVVLALNLKSRCRVCLTF